eukprot:163173_1
MGTSLSKNEKQSNVLSNANDFIDIKTQMNYVVMYWYQKHKLSIFPLNMVKIIIDFIYRPIFEIEHQYKLIFKDTDIKYLKLTPIGDKDCVKQIMYRWRWDNSFDEILTIKNKSDSDTFFVNINGKQINVKLTYPFDSWTKERFDGIILIYDITRRESFENIRDLNKQLQIENESRRSCNITYHRMLIGENKYMENRRSVTYKEGKELAQELDIQLFRETSARQSNKDVMETVQSFAKQMVFQPIPEQRSNHPFL